MPIGMWGWPGKLEFFSIFVQIYIVFPAGLFIRWRLIKRIKEDAPQEWNKIGCAENPFRSELIDPRFDKFMFQLKYRRINSWKIRLLGDLHLLFTALLYIVFGLMVIGGIARAKISYNDIQNSVISAVTGAWERTTRLDHSRHASAELGTDHDCFALFDRNAVQYDIMWSDPYFTQSGQVNRHRDPSRLSRRALRLLLDRSKMAATHPIFLVEVEQPVAVNLALRQIDDNDEQCVEPPGSNQHLIEPAERIPIDVVHVVQKGEA